VTDVKIPAVEAEVRGGYVVDRVVVCDAYREPERHYQLLSGGRSKLTGGRRPSMRYLASAKATKGGIAGVVGKEATLFEDMAASEAQLNEFVNELRGEVRDWREAGYPNTATCTRALLDWWFERDEERMAEGKRLFFCQQEAIETVIYLYEARHRFRAPETGSLLRYALKLATGTGKTMVMATLIVWATVHRAKVSGSSLSQNFLVLTPNLTVRDRVWGTDPLTQQPTSKGLNPDSPENLYDEFDMVPPQLREVFRPNVTVRNWQGIPLQVSRDDWVNESELIGEEGRFLPASVLDALRRRQRTRKNPRSALRKVIGNWHDLIVINDEAHHAYGEKRTKKGEESDFIKWSRIIEQLSKAATVPLIVDVSATPWYGSGSPKPEGQLFEWLVCDFSVYDAFESGLVKVVRLPDPSEEGAKYLDLWDYVKGAKTKSEYISGCRGAVANIYASWKEDYTAWEEQFEELRLGPPPVLLVVADTAVRAAWMREHLTSDYELLRNPSSDDPTEWVTIQVDSKVFDADKGNEAILREIVNTVGRPGKAGEHVRCIVSVNMLSEGWDVKNVSHILGLRAFGSPLLTEQVIGRGLRRVDYSALNVPLKERMANKDRPDEETVDAFGIPFIGFPVEKRKRPKAGEWGRQSTTIGVDEKRDKYKISLPNVRSWAVGVTRPLAETVTVEALQELVIDSKETPLAVTVKPVVGDNPRETMTVQLFRDEWPLLRSKLDIAKDLFDSLSSEEAGVLTGPTFEEIFALVDRFIDERVRTAGAALKQDIGIYYWRERVFEILENAIRETPTDMQTVPLFGDPRYFETASVPDFKWPGIAADGRKTHWTKVPCHTDLEAQFAAFLDGARDVVKYAKNERLGFSITYHDQGRARQYHPDFVVQVRSAGGDYSWWLAETKGEIRVNTSLKTAAAELWCERMTRAGQGKWRYLFVQQRTFEKALRAGVADFATLVDELQDTARQPLKLLPAGSPGIEKLAFVTHLPVYTLEAAAGHFGEGHAVEPEGWVDAAAMGKLDEQMFVARVTGRSMEPVMFDGEWAIFRANPTGTRQGKIVLAEGPIFDPELGGSFTVKKYVSERQLDPDGSWRHRVVKLLSTNPEFQPIVVEQPADGDESGGVRIAAEYIGKLPQAARGRGTTKETLTLAGMETAESSA
jgi:type III restriction enzyme